jgi:hypothetical protein
MPTGTDSGSPLGLSRYDLVLLCIPAAFLLATVVRVWLDLPPHVATAAGGLVSSLALADALFRNPPLGS